MMSIGRAPSLWAKHSLLFNQHHQFKFGMAGREKCLLPIDHFALTWMLEMAFATFTAQYILLCPPLVECRAFLAQCHHALANGIGVGVMAAFGTKLRHHAFGALFPINDQRF